MTNMINCISLDAFTDGSIALQVLGYDIVHVTHYGPRTVLVTVHAFDDDGDLYVVYSKKIEIKDNPCT